MKKNTIYSHSSKKGFTLIELLIAIAIVAILAVVAFVSLNPLLRFQNARDAARWTDVSAILDAIAIDVVDNATTGGGYLDPELTTNIVDDYYYMIGTSTTNCNTYNSICDITILNGDDCVDVGDLVTEGYLAYVPVSPNGAATANWSSAVSGYYLVRNAEGSITIGACESEAEPFINVSR